MIVRIHDTVERLVLEGDYFLKLIPNDSSVILFPGSIQHSEAGQDGIRYADDGVGNAIAGTMKQGCMDFRFHPRFSDQRVERIAKAILALPEFRFARGFRVTYQARVLLES